MSARRVTGTILMAGSFLARRMQSVLLASRSTHSLAIGGVSTTTGSIRCFSRPRLRIMRSTTMQPARYRANSIWFTTRKRRAMSRSSSSACAAAVSTSAHHRAVLETEASTDTEKILSSTKPRDGVHEIGDTSVGVEGREVLSREAWQRRAEDHRARVRALTDGSVHHDRKDPIFNFLFEYYHFKPRILLQWTPGIEVYLLDADPTLKGCPLPQKGWEPGPDGGGGQYNPFSLNISSRRALGRQRDLLAASSERPPVYHCFGLHEWAMLYRPPGSAEDGRSIHQALPLRVSQEVVNAMVEGSGGSMGCTHFDAFRFFAPEARPLNSVQLSRESRLTLDQPGCVHANMDLFKWALHMWPTISSEDLFDALELAVSCRMLDMRASPYDLSVHGRSEYDGRGGGLVGGLPAESWDPTPVRIETEAGRKEYQQGQLDLYRRSLPIRKKLLQRMDRLLEIWRKDPLR